jgi:hypothetical protein
MSSASKDVFDQLLGDHRLDPLRQLGVVEVLGDAA